MCVGAMTWKRVRRCARDCYSLIRAVMVIMSECVLFRDKKAEPISECSLLTLRSLFTFCVNYFPHISGPCWALRMMSGV